MKALMYDELVSWYRLLDPPADHRDEAAVYRDALLAAVPKARTLLELGAGAGHNALFLKQHFECTLTDISEGMLQLSRELNPECEHLSGDMRTLRLGRSFDVVFVHDAVCYMQSAEELRAAMVTAFEHLEAGGAVLIAPDVDRESFAEETQLYEVDEGGRSLRCLEWMWDPDPNDTRYSVDYVFLLREGDKMQTLHDRHIEGLFPRQRWLELLTSVGFESRLVKRDLDDGGLDYVLLGLKR